MKKEATRSYISLVYNNLKYYINVNEINLGNGLYISSDGQKSPFDSIDFLNVNLSYHPNQKESNSDETLAEVRNAVAVNLNQLDIAQYVDYTIENDYYTDIICTFVNDVDLVIEKMVESLSKDFFHVVAS